MFFVYILRTYNNKFYTGHTSCLDRRETEHRRNWHGAKYIKDSGEDFKIVHVEKFPDRASAMKREKQIKGWSRAKKQALIDNDFLKLKKLAKKSGLVDIA